MASLLIPTNVPTHPEISIDSMEFRSEQVVFRWVGGPHSGDCAVPFTLSLAEHGELTVNQVVELLKTAMIATLPVSQ